MDKVYKICGIIIPLLGIIIAYMLVNSFDIRSITTENDFITAMLHSDAVYELTNKAKMILGIAITCVALCFGLLSFGIGLILKRLRKLS
jgi:hypothetical protein